MLIQTRSQLIYSGTGGSPPVKFNVIDSISIWYDLGNAMISYSNCIHTRTHIKQNQKIQNGGTAMAVQAVAVPPVMLHYKNETVLFHHHGRIMCHV